MHSGELGQGLWLLPLVKGNRGHVTGDRGHMACDTSQWFCFILTAKLGRFYKLFFELAVAFFGEDGVKTRPVLKQAWPGKKLGLNTKMKYLVRVGENLMFVKTKMKIPNFQRQKKQIFLLFRCNRLNGCISRNRIFTH